MQITFILYKIKNIINTIKYMYQWMKFGYTDFQWDYSTIFLALKFKLNLMLTIYSKNNKSYHSNDTARYIRKSILLIDKIVDEYYEDQDLIFHDNNVYTIDNDVKKLLHINYIKRLLTRYNMESCYFHVEDNYKLSIIRHLRQKEVQRVLFKLLNEKIESWWD